MIDFASLGWPPTAQDVARLADYERRQQLYESDHATAFANKSAKIPKGLKSKVYLIQDYPRLISRVCADLLFSEPPILSMSGQQDRLNALISSNMLFASLYEAELGKSFRGDAVYRVRLDGDARRVAIEEIPAYSYFAELDPDNMRNVLSQAIAWVREVGGRRYLRVEHHMAGLIRNEQFVIREQGLPTHMVATQPALNLGKLVRVPVGEGYATPPEEEIATGVPFPLVVHVPNDRHGSQFWGSSDYTIGLESLFDEANQRITQIARVLDKHADPKLKLPEDVKPRDGRALDTTEMEAIYVPTGPEYANLPAYLTWNAQLDSAFQQLEKVADLIFKFSEISPAVFGEDKAGSIESGKAMKFRFMRTLAKISGKRRYWGPAIERILQLAMLLEEAHLGAPAPGELVIEWRDGLPHDYGEAIANEAARKAAGLTDDVSAIQKIDQVTQTAAAEMVARIGAQAPEPAPEPSPVITPGQPGFE